MQIFDVPRATALNVAEDGVIVPPVCVAGVPGVLDSPTALNLTACVVHATPSLSGNAWPAESNGVPGATDGGLHGVVGPAVRNAVKGVSGQGTV